MDDSHNTKEPAFKKSFELNGFTLSNAKYWRDCQGPIFRNDNLRALNTIIAKHPARRLVNVAYTYSYLHQLYASKLPTLFEDETRLIRLCLLYILDTLNRFAPNKS